LWSEKFRWFWQTLEEQSGNLKIDLITSDIIAVERSLVEDVQGLLVRDGEAFSAAIDLHVGDGAWDIATCFHAASS
jgi:hypothetical protein